MGYLSDKAAYALIYSSYGVFLIVGLLAAWKLSRKDQYVAALRSQPPIPLAFNFIASAMGCGILLTYPQIGAILGIQGVFVYAISSASPLMLFAFVGPLVRKRCPKGFVLEEWVFQRYGYITGLYFGGWTIFTIFLFAASELSCLYQIVQTMTGINGLPVIIIEAVVTTIYTFWGGCYTSFFTDNIQGLMFFILLIICSVAMGTTIDIDRSLIEPSGLTKASLVGWQLVYIFPVAIFTNDVFLSGFWLRTFASRTDKELFIACGIATVVVFIFLVLTGFAGILAVWSGLYNYNDDPDNAGLSFFIIVDTLPSWVMGFVLVFVVALSTAVLDSFQTALTSSISNDVFRNKIPVFYCRILSIIVIIPSVVVALKATNVLNLYLICDLASAAVVPMILSGLINALYFISGFEVMVGGLGGIFTTWLFGTGYYHSAKKGGGLLIMEDGLYTGDWGPFFAFVTAPFGGIIWGLIALALRSGAMYIYSRTTGKPFTVFERKFESAVMPTGSNDSESSDELDENDNEDIDDIEYNGIKRQHIHSKSQGSDIKIDETEQTTTIDGSPKNVPQTRKQKILALFALTNDNESTTDSSSSVQEVKKRKWYKELIY